MLNKVNQKGRLVILIVICLLLAPVYSAMAVSYQYDDLNRLERVDYDNGTAIIYTYDEVGNRQQTVVSVPTYTLTATAGSGGNISPTGAVTVNAGGGQTFAIAPNTCYHIADVTVDSVSQGAITSYSFTNVTANHSINSTFAINTYTITGTAGSGGSITPTSATVNCGGSQAFTITPNTGYHIVDVKVDNVSQGAISSYTFNNVTASHTISATFAINTYTITATAGSNGTISPSGTVTVNYGANQTFTITAAKRHTIANVVVDGVSKGAISSYTFTNVTSNHAISATFN
ncbi:MAG TPA: hypothetical protein VI298_08310 [Geobacteraceae bacterium]